MLAAVLALSLFHQSNPIERDDYGVPHILASSLEDAFYHAGYAVAEDRLWQMETNRRLARGKMAEIFGKGMAASDTEVLKMGYTDEELATQVKNLSGEMQQVFGSYTRGVNAYIDQATREDKLPEGYAKNDFRPEPWTDVDSAAITVRLFQLFGRGGAGEARNLAVYTYFQTQAVKSKVLDAVDDFLWINEPSSPTTIQKQDDLLAEKHPAFPNPSRQETEHQLNVLPKFTLFDLLPGLRLMSHEDSDMLAMQVAAPYKAGSYAIAVSQERSATGHALLLGAPQMGFSNPSIVHEMSISCPQYAAVGLDVPGVPGIAIGHTQNLAWTLTSGVADTDDLYCFKDEGSSYAYGNEHKPFRLLTRPIKIKGEADQKVEQKRTMWGPVVISSQGAGAVLARRSSYWMRELESMETFVGIARAKNADEVEQAVKSATMSFNFFYATKDGDAGYRYVGLIPIRPEGIDPRFPLIGSPATDWKGYIPFDQMPHVRNPKEGLITNWNNKPVAWWFNSDTPAWGRTFRNEALNSAIPAGKLTPQDLEMAAWTIARRDFFAPHLMPLIRKAFDPRPPTLDPVEADALSYLLSFDGRMLESSPGATIYGQFVKALREELFLKSVGNLASPDTFELALQPSLILNALEGKTKFDFLARRKANEVVRAAFTKAVERQKARDPDLANWGYKAPVINFTGEPPVPYSNRGTYIQIVELRPKPAGRNVVAPGVAEEGSHSKDQIALSRAWIFKAMRLR